jgi:chemotaxis response regulator CheB
VIAQDPDTAACADMPLSAIATGAVDRVLALEAIAAALVERVAWSLDRDAEQRVGSA